MTAKRAYSYLPLPHRLVSLVIYLLLLYCLHVLITQQWSPALSGPGLWLVSAIAYLSYSLLDTPFFIPPRQALASGLTAGLILLTIHLPAADIAMNAVDVVRWLAVGIAFLTVAASTAAIILHQPRLNSQWSKVAFDLSKRLGDGRILFTPPALLSIFAYHGGSTGKLLLLTFGWAVLVLVRPIELLWISLRQLRRDEGTARGGVVGEIYRIDDPSIVRVSLSDASGWQRDMVHVACLPDSTQVPVIPLLQQAHAEGVRGTGIIRGSIGAPFSDMMPGMVYRPQAGGEIDSALNEDPDRSANLVGFVVEESRISGIHFEVAAETELEEGMLVFCRQGDQTVYYQILDAKTTEESFGRNPSGVHRAVAGQLGRWEPQLGFVKYPWLPEMNSPVFLFEGTAGREPEDGGDADHFFLGDVPGTRIPVHAKFSEILEYHTAVLGVTGTGKTELVFDLIRHGLSSGAKIFCVDLTEEYRQRLDDLQPHILGFDDDDMDKLERLIDAVETGEYSAAAEKEQLNAWLRSTKPKIDQRVDAFLRADGGALGIFELPEIANTRATLRATELYLSAIFSWARKHRRARRILIVLEEAHTVIPEMTLFPRDRADTYAVVGRMAQIALQGRKYGVGLLLVSQRTALVSKSLLSQCNTVLSFTMYDKTGLDYLRTIYGEEHVRAIPNLGFLQGIAFGKAVRSDRPILFEIPYVEDKKKASEELRKSVPALEEEPETVDEDDDIPF